MDPEIPDTASKDRLNRGQDGRPDELRLRHIAEFWPPMAEAARNRWKIAVESRQWMCLLPAIPFLTDLVETGAIPATPRGWITELVVGMLIAALVRRIRRDLAAATSLARKDALTGLGNRRAFDEVLEHEWTRSRRSGQPLSLVLIDLDNFKQINDTFGHDVGDAVLQQIAEAIAHTVREKIDSGFRLGGDEFALLLPASNALEATAVIARIRARCALFTHRTGRGPVFSAGSVELDKHESAGQFVQRADSIMYQQKRLRQRAR